jgi:hypothetical protein
MRRIRIVYDRTSRHPRVIDVETGESLPALEVDWHADVDGCPTAVVRIAMAEIDAEGPARLLAVCPECGREAEVPGDPRPHEDIKS